MKELINLQLMMFALIIIGLILKKTKVIGKEGQKSMTNLVIDLILPCNIIFSFMIKFSSKIAQDFMVILIISILIQVFCVILGSVLYNKCSVKRKKCLRYATICSNAGFLGNPIAQGVYGMMGLTLASIYLIPQRIMMWSEGVSVFTEAPTKKEMLKKIFSLFVCAMMCLISTNLVFADGTVDIHGTYSIHIGGYDWGSATDNKKAENNPSQAIKTGDTAHGEIYAMIMMFAAAGYVFFKQRKGA